jgi:hypothetical protein
MEGGGYCFEFAAFAAASKSSRIHWDLDFLADRAAASISSSSEFLKRHFNLASLESPFASGGLPLLAFIGAYKKYFMYNNNSFDAP